MSHASYWDDLLKKEFAKETDRAAVILVASLMEHSVGVLLKNFLVANSGREDDLFDGPNAPLSNFSARIDMAHRLGLISSKFARDLHLIRKIRNEFAHNLQECNFNNGAVRSRVQQLVSSSDMVNKNPEIRKKDFGEPGPRGDFLLISSWMLYWLNQEIEEVKPLIEPKLEWGYLEDSREDSHIQNQQPELPPK
jgi:DNA-binding MltR family transcriptional regulator